MSSISSVGTTPPIYQPATQGATHPKPSTPAPTNSGGDPDHDGDSGSGLDVKG